MVAFVFAIILLLIGIGAGVACIVPKEEEKKEVPVKDKDGNVVMNWRGQPQTEYVVVGVERPYKKYSWIGFVVGSVLFLILFFVSITCSVPTGHTGVVSVFGRVEDRTYDAGFHFKAPWATVDDMDNRVQKATIDLQCFSSDIQEVECQYTLNYQINKNNAQIIYKTVGKDYYDTVIVPNVAESVKTIMAHYTAENLIGNRDELAANIEELLGTQLEKYNIEVVSTAIEDMDFTDEFTNAVEAKQVAAQNKLKAETEQAQKTMEATQAAARAKIEAEAAAEVAEIQAQANAEVAKIQAEAAKEIAKTKAEGESDAVQIAADAAAYKGEKEAEIALQRLASINGWTVVKNETTGVNELLKNDGSKVTAEELKVGTEKLIEYYYITSWNGILPETYVGDTAASTIILGTNP